MPKKKNIPIKYTSRDFQSIKEDLIDHAQRYYSDTYKDFSVASFGSLMIDTVAYVGDVLSFYLDYQVNESFLDSAIEYDNVRRLASNYGYNYTNNSNSYGIISAFVIVPSNSDGFAGTKNYIKSKNIKTHRIITVGGSTVEQNDLDMMKPFNKNLTWPYLLEKKLNKKNKRYQVINAGCAGYTIIETLISLMTKLIFWKPNTIIYLLSINDIITIM